MMASFSLHPPSNLRSFFKVLEGRFSSDGPLLSNLVQGSTSPGFQGGQALRFDVFRTF